MKCPFLEEMVVRYCNAYPVRKLIPCNSQTPSICLTERCVECPAYEEMALAHETRSKEVDDMEVSAEVRSEESVADSKECIWMKLGVVSYRMCLLDYDCQSCDFNQTLMDANWQYQEAPGLLSVLHRLRSLPAEERKCRYMLTGDVSYKLCAHNYQCATCEYDQRMQDAIDFHPRVVARRARTVTKEKVRGFFVPRDLYFSANHMWVRVEKDGRVRVGLDDFAQRLLGKIERVHPPSEGARVRQGEECWSIESGRRAARLSLPLDGTIERVNNALTGQKGLINKDPYGEGWIFFMRPRDLADSLRGLLKGKPAADWLDKEADRLTIRVERELGAIVADGGSISDKLSDEEWDGIVKEFFK